MFILNLEIRKKERVYSRLLANSKLKLTHPSLVELGLGLSLVIFHMCFAYLINYIQY